MSRTLLPLSAALALMGGAAFAEAPRVAVDVAPVHSLVARVMEGVGTPDLIVQAGASPHEYALRPSDATALQEADLVFWVSPDLTPWLGKAIDTLATKAAATELLEAEGTTELEIREGALFEAHDHGKHSSDKHAEKGPSYEEHGDDDHGHDHGDHGHEGHNHAEHSGDNAEEMHEHAEEDHGDHDPHAWLSPQNAATWLNVIAAQLSAADPENAGEYSANAAAGVAEIEALSDEINAMLEPVRAGRFIVFHDAYQYFETAFDFPASGAISLSDASAPSPARVAEIRDRISNEGIDCVLAEPQFNPGLVEAVLEGTEAGTGILDPLGADLEPGPSLYPQLLRNLASSLADCL